jgi:hypothetical protein
VGGISFNNWDADNDKVNMQQQGKEENDTLFKSTFIVVILHSGGIHFLDFVAR